MGSMPVVLVDPRSEMAEALGGVLVELSVGPFADGGLDKAFGFAVSARERVRLGLMRSLRQFAAKRREQKQGPLSVSARRTVMPRREK